MTACYKNAGRWLAGRRPPSYADSGPCPALWLALLAVCAFLVLASWLLLGDLYGRVFRETIVAVIITVVRGRGNTSFAADICATCLLQPVFVVAGPPLGVATAAVAAVARGAPYIFSSRHVLGLVTACILFMGMLNWPLESVLRGRTWHLWVHISHLGLMQLSLINPASSGLQSV